MTTVVRVKIAQLKYNPQKVEIEAGQSIVWENSDAMGHTATRTVDPKFDTGSIATGGQSQPVVFNDVTPEAGIEYFCRPHPFMKGWIVVKAPASDGGR